MWSCLSKNAVRKDCKQNVYNPVTAEAALEDFRKVARAEQGRPTVLEMEETIYNLADINTTLLLAFKHPCRARECKYARLVVNTGTEHGRNMHHSWRLHKHHEWFLATLPHHAKPWRPRHTTSLSGVVSSSRTLRKAPLVLTSSTHPRVFAATP